MAVRSFTGRKRVRKSFGRIPSVAPMPNLIEVQKNSYESFLQREATKAERSRERSPGGVPLGLPDPGFFRPGHARIRRLRVRRSQI